MIPEKIVFSSQEPGPKGAQYKGKEKEQKSSLLELHGKKQHAANHDEVAKNKCRSKGLCQASSMTVECEWLSS